MKNLILTLMITTVIFSITNAQAKEGVRYSSITPLESKIKSEKVENVKWSGYVLETIKEDESSCLVIHETKVDRNNRPIRSEAQKNSRFVACLGGDSEVTKFYNKLVTITGDIAAFTDYHNNKNETYKFPIVVTSKIHVWNEQAERPALPEHYSMPRESIYNGPDNIL